MKNGEKRNERVLKKKRDGVYNEEERRRIE